MKITLPKYGQHLVFLGTTGSGKTVLAEEMLSRFSSYFVIDTKDEMEIDGRRITSPGNLPVKLKLFKRIVYVPRPEYREGNIWNYVFRKLLENSTKEKPRPRVIYIDEIYHLGYGASFPTWLARGITTARSKKLSFWISTQRPANIPIPVLSEATRFYIFYLPYEEDIKKVGKFVIGRDLWKDVKSLKLDHCFLEFDRNRQTLRKLPKIRRD